MNSSEAQEKFNISSRQIYELGKAKLCGIHKAKGKWVIPDNNSVLIPIIEIRRFLFQILQFKNNPGYVFPRDLCPSDEVLRLIIDQQYYNGFLGDKANGDTMPIC